ncbi:hypothetical protein BGZ58_008636, partial [Dissophora ornata]
NMANVVQGHLLKQERLDYLQPMAQDGSFPWKEKRGVGPSTSSSTAAAATSSASGTQGRRKRAPTTSRPDQQRPQKTSKS